MFWLFKFLLDFTNLSLLHTSFSTFFAFLRLLMVLQFDFVLVLSKLLLHLLSTYLSNFYLLSKLVNFSGKVMYSTVLCNDEATMNLSKK